MPCLPDSVHVMTDDTRPHTASSTTEGVWTVRGAQVTAEHTPNGLRVRARAGAEGLSRIMLRWRVDVAEGARILGDAWERGYGDLQWRTLQPDRALPWYVLISGGEFGGPSRTDADLAAAVRLALDGGTPGGVEPLDWLSTTAPRRWRSGTETLVYDWAEPWGATPLPV